MPEIVADAALPRLVATDLDGTLLRDDGTISARTANAIATLADSGVPTVFVTARPPRWLHALVDSVGEHGVAICANGALVYDVAERRVVAARTIDPAALVELERDLRAAVPGIVFAVERADGMGREHGFVYQREQPVDFTVGTFEQITAEPVGKLLARCEASDPHEFHAAVAAALAGRGELGYSGAVGLAEITAQGVTKASGLERWCELHEISSADVWAFGDMPNDLPMLAWAGRSFAVANAHPDVLELADDVVGRNDDDGVAEVLEGLVRRAAGSDVTGR